MRPSRLRRLAAAARGAVAALACAWSVGVAAQVCNAGDAGPPLSASEVREIVAEARAVAGQRRQLERGARDAFVPTWRSLDRSKLARLVRMPEFATIRRDAKETLVDQAGAWDLIQFTRASDALALWDCWFPGTAEPTAAGADRASSPKSWIANPDWTSEAGAMLALFDCLPAPAWSVLHDDPMLWVMERGTAWDPPNEFDFGKCVRSQRHGFDAPVTAARGSASAAILEDKLSAQLLAQGCEGEGPDRCLPLLYALHSLNPRHPQLPVILKKVEAHFAPEREIVVPESLQAGAGPFLVATEAQIAEARALARAALPKVFYLTVKLPVLLDRPEQWPADEIDRTVGQLLRLSLVIQSAGRPTQWRSPLKLRDDRYYPFANPWVWIQSPETRLPALGQSLERWGAEYARFPGCDGGKPAIPSPQFWLAYSLSKLASERITCRALPGEWIGALYAKALAQGDARVLDPIGALRRQVDSNGPARSEVLAAVEGPCRAQGSSARSDPWGLCGMIDAARASEQAARPVEPPTCPDDMSVTVARYLGYLGPPSWSDCRIRPDEPRTSIVALLFPRPGGASGESDVLDLEVLTVDSETGLVRSRLLIEKAYRADALQRLGITIDTARYRLAPDVRAFGVRIERDDETSLSLYVEQGMTFRRILRDLPVRLSRGDRDADCGGGGSDTERTLSVAAKRTRGWADLVVRSRAAASAIEPAGGRCVETGRRPVRSSVTLRHDGRSYPVPESLR